MKTYEHIEVQTLQDGTVRVYGNGGMVFEARGKNVRSMTSVFPEKKLPSGEVVRKKD